MTTKKEKIEQFDTMKRERDLLSLYLYDSTWKLNLDATETHTEKIRGEVIKVTGRLYRSRGADGGYAVIQTLAGKDGRDEYIGRLDDCSISDVSEFTLPARIVIERLRIARQRIWNSSLEPVSEIVNA